MNLLAHFVEHAGARMPLHVDLLHEGPGARVYWTVTVAPWCRITRPAGFQDAPCWIGWN